MSRNGRFRVLLIAPTALDFSGHPIKERRLHLPGLTLPTLAAVTPDDAEVRLVFETVESIPFDEHWDLVGLTSMGSGIVRAWQICEQFRALGAKTVIGGIGASLGEADWSTEFADAVVQGEGDEIWSQVVRDAAAGKLRPIYRAQQLPALTDLPVPRYDLMNRKVLGFWRPVQATRGCPFACTFCSVTSFFSGVYRKRPVRDVVRDVRAARLSGSRYIAFVDDNLIVDFDYCAELFEALISERIIWMSQASLQITENSELMKLAQRSGCRLLSFGLESVSESSLAMIAKGWNQPQRYQTAIQALRKCGIEVSTEMIVGLDGDDESTFERTYQFIMKTGIAVPRVHIVTPVPGTPLFAELWNQGRIVSTKFSDYTGGKVVFKPAKIDARALEQDYWKLYRALYAWPSIIRRIWPNRARLGPYMWAVVLASNIRYHFHIKRRISPGIL